MSTPNPMMPQGSLQPTQGKSTIKITVLTILAIHVVVLGGLLMQGCSKDDKGKPQAGAKTNEVASLPPLDTNSLPVVNNNLTPLPAPTTTNNVVDLAPAAPQLPKDEAGPSATKEYIVAKGDTLGKIAHANGVTVDAITKANPNLNPNKLQIKQKIVIPAPHAPVVAAAKSTGGTAAPSTDGAPSSTYEVKAGDNLAKIAKSHGTSINAIKVANNLKTTQIRVGQKLKLPMKAPGTAEATKEAAVSPAAIATVGGAPTAKQ